MSQTETILLVVLGFSLASLIALFIGRMMWGAALRLGARRMQRQVPSSVVGLQTERDRLRAEYAMLSQRLGARIETMKIAMAEHMAEVSRHRNRLESLQADVTARDAEIAARDAEIQRLAQENARLVSDADSARATAEDLRGKLAEAEHAAAESPSLTVVPAAETAGEADAPAPLGDDGERLRRRIDRLNRMASAVARDRTRPGPPDTIVLPPRPPTDPLIVAKLEEAERQTGDLQRDLERLDAEWSKKLGAAKADAAARAHSAEPEARDESEPVEKDDGPAAVTVANVISLANRIRELRKGITKP